MGPPDDTTGGASVDLDRLERSLRRALATAESDETRYHVRTALQYLEVLHEHERRSTSGRSASREHT